ncbi:MAG: glucokinase [Maritimibacter sp.]
MTALNALSLLADIGGTNTRLALSQGRRLLPDTIKRYANAEYASLDDVLAQYLSDIGQPDCVGACVAVAGPVRAGVAHMTNLAWTISETTLARATRAQTVALLNDLPAQGYALDNLAPNSVTPLIGTPPDVAPQSNATRLVIGIGTGFNSSPVFDVEAMGRHVPASESGHVTLPLKDTDIQPLAAYLAREHGFAAVEDALSGRGLAALFAFETQHQPPSAPLTSAAVLEAYAAGLPEAQRAVALFTRLLGAVVGDLALMSLPFEGIFLVGGMARAISPLLLENGFQAALTDKGRFSDFVADFSVSVVEDDYAALTGCACYLAQKQALKKTEFP